MSSVRPGLCVSCSAPLVLNKNIPSRPDLFGSLGWIVGFLGVGYWVRITRGILIGGVTGKD